MRFSPLRDFSAESTTLNNGRTAPAVWPTLLVVDDDPAMLQALAWFFEKRGFHVAAASTLAEARSFCQRHRGFSLVVSDYHLPDGTGAEFCWWLREEMRMTPPFLLMSGSQIGTVTCPEGVDFLAKPFSLEELESRVRSQLTAGRRA